MFVEYFINGVDGMSMFNCCDVFCNNYFCVSVFSISVGY